MPKKIILVVDDHADTRLLVSAQLKKHQCDTVFAADALQAMTVARKIRPDAIILDLGLPAGSGFIVLERLKSNTLFSNIPVIILTADESPETKFKGLDAGAVAVLHKPVKNEALIAAVDSALGGMLESPITGSELQR